MLGILSEVARGAVQKGYVIIFLVSVLEVAIPVLYWVVLSPKGKEEEED